MSNNPPSTSAAAASDMTYSSLTTQPQLTRTASETTLVNPNQRSDSSKDNVKHEEIGACPSDDQKRLYHYIYHCPMITITNMIMTSGLDSDRESKVTLNDPTMEASSSGSIKKTVAKVKSKLKGKPSTNPSTQKNKNTIYTPSALSTWQAIAGMLLVDPIPMCISLTTSCRTKVR